MAGGTAPEVAPRSAVPAVSGEGHHRHANFSFDDGHQLGVMPVPLTAAQWLIRAEDARLEAEAMTDPEAKRAMLMMAVGYEKLAEEQSGLPHEAARTDFTD
jgi:hypothetical protein